jgi:hypothetical protein
MAGIGIGIGLIVELFFVVLAIVAWVKVISKAGYSGWWVLIGLIPLVGAVMFLVFAFSKWPIEESLEAARRANQSGGHSNLSGGGGWSPLGGPPPGAPQGWGPPQPGGPYAPTGSGPSWDTLR